MSRPLRSRASRVVGRTRLRAGSTVTSSEPTPEAPRHVMAVDSPVRSADSPIRLPHAEGYQWQARPSWLVTKLTFEKSIVAGRGGLSETWNPNGRRINAGSAASGSRCPASSALTMVLAQTRGHRATTGRSSLSMMVAPSSSAPSNGNWPTDRELPRRADIGLHPVPPPSARAYRGRCAPVVRRQASQHRAVRLQTKHDAISGPLTVAAGR